MTSTLLSSMQKFSQLLVNYTSLMLSLRCHNLKQNMAGSDNLGTGNLGYSYLALITDVYLSGDDELDDDDKFWVLTIGDQFVRMVKKVSDTHKAVELKPLTYKVDEVGLHAALFPQPQHKPCVLAQAYRPDVLPVSCIYTPKDNVYAVQVGILIRPVFDKPLSVW